jgi:ATP-dependent protease ClpP protease subunit
MEKEIVIRFMADVKKESIDALFHAIDIKLKEGIKKFKILISSPGGTVFHGISAYNFLKGIPAEIETYNFGTVDSIATVIYCAGSKRFCVPNARFLIHGVGWGTNGPARFEEKQLKEQIKGLEIDRENIARIIAENCNKKPEEVEKMMYDGTTLNPEQAKEFGLVHDIKEIKLLENVEIIAIN